MLAKLRKLRYRFLNANKIKPLERFTKDIQWLGNFNAPEVYYEYYFVDRQYGIVGELSGGMSPLQDTFYLHEIRVPHNRQHNHYEHSMLANIAQLYSVPITPMSSIHSGFLDRLRKTSHGHFELNAQIKASDMCAEILKWVHLSKDTEK